MPAASFDVRKRAPDTSGIGNPRATYVLILPMQCFAGAPAELLTGNLTYAESTVEIVYNEHEDHAEFARYNRFSL